MAYWLTTTILLTVHLLAMNLAAGGPVIAVWLLRDGEAGAALARWLLKWSLAGLAWGSLAGGATLLLPNEAMRAALARFPASAYWYALTELLFSLACVAILWRATAAMQRRRWLAWALAILASSNLLYHFPPWLSVLGRLVAEPRWGPPGTLQRRDVLKLIGTGEPLALTAHFALATFAVTAMAALWASTRMPAVDADDGPSDATLPVRGLALWALVPTLLQLPVGIWLLAAGSDRLRHAVMGGDPVASLCFIAALPAAFFLTQRLASLALGETDPAHIRRAGWHMLATVLLMSGSLRGAREAPLTTGPTRPHLQGAAQSEAGDPIAAESPAGVNSNG